ncbi:MAG: hypothetical protein ACI9Y7_003096, partial [Dokdonia sp.]
FIFIAYNLRRIFNILDQNTIKEYLKAQINYIFIITSSISTKMKSYTSSTHFYKLNPVCIENTVNQLKFIRILTIKRGF